LNVSDFHAEPTARVKNKRKVVNNNFDELAKSLAQFVTRRAALKKFGVGLAGIALAAVGLANKAQAHAGGKCHRWVCSSGNVGTVVFICGGKKLKYPCQDEGIVDCSYCGHKCC